MYRSDGFNLACICEDCSGSIHEEMPNMLFKMLFKTTKKAHSDLNDAIK
jgi:hypothetical protein